jgi:hypothetical protein
MISQFTQPLFLPASAVRAKVKLPLSRGAEQAAPSTNRDDQARQHVQITLPKEFVMRFLVMRFLIVIALVLLTAKSATAQRAPNFGAEWTQLFNGTDLTGWQKIGNEKWVVEDGAIYGEGVTEEYGYLASEKTYQDFHLSLRFKCEASGNSGVYIHTSFEPGTARVTAGRQIEIDRAIGNHTGGIYGDARGWIVWPAPELETVIRPDDWNDMLIKVEGRRYVTYLNGVQMIDFTYPTERRRDNSVATNGVIALQLHSGGEGRMRFKDIWIRDLSH